MDCTGNMATYFLLFCYCIYLLSHSVNGYYLIADYYMDQDHNRAFGGACRQTVRDPCAFINSHVNNLQLANYAGNRDCWMILDAGNTQGAMYRMEFEFWDLEPGLSKGRCVKDYLEFYDGKGVNKSTYFGRYCGDEPPKMNRFPSQRYITLRFISDDTGFYKGFKIKAIRTEPAPCAEDRFYCEEEDKCIDLRLKCDGTEQCTGGQDELNCDTLDKFVSFFLSRGLVGLIGIGCAIFISCIMMWVLISCCCRNKLKKKPRRGRR